MATAPASAQLRTVAWNMLDGPVAGDTATENAVRTVFQAIADETVNGIARPIDVMTVQETNRNALINTISLLNDVYGRNVYSGIISTNNFDQVGMVWNTETVVWDPTTAVQVTGDPRPAVRSTFQPIGYSSDEAAFTVYSFHLKAGGSDSDFDRRAATARQYRLDANQLGEGANVIFSGDFNTRRSTEGGFANFTLPGNAQAFDPVNRLGTWKNNPSFADVHTHGTNDIDDRFDFQLVTGELLDNEGLSYIGQNTSTGSVHSYRAFQNNGQLYNQSINSSSRYVGLSPEEAARQRTIHNALRASSDHLPVVMDLQVPAKMGVDVLTANPVAYVGATTTLDIAVGNRASVSSIFAADELDYNITIDGGSTYNGSGTIEATTADDVHQFELFGTSAGQLLLDIDVTSNSKAVENGTSSQTVAVDVLDRGQLSLSADEIITDLTINLGTLQPGELVPFTYDLFNLEKAIGLTASVLIDEIETEGGIQAALASDEIDANEQTRLTGQIDLRRLQGDLFSESVVLYWRDTGPLSSLGSGELTLNFQGQIGELIPTPTAFAALPLLLTLTLRRRR